MNSEKSGIFPLVNVSPPHSSIIIIPVEQKRHKKHENDHWRLLKPQRITDESKNILMTCSNLNLGSQKIARRSHFENRGQERGGNFSL